MDDKKIVALCSAISAYVNGADPTLATRKSSVALGEAMYISHVCFGLSMSRVAAQFGAQRETASQQILLVEDRRINSSYDEKISALEGVITSLKSL